MPIGDSGYTAAPWMLTPMLHQPEGTPGFRYTAAHCSTRNCVERCIGVLKGRWRCTRRERTLHYGPEVAAVIIIACCVLHNIAVEHRLPEPRPVLEIVDALPPYMGNIPRADNASYFREGIALRNRLIRLRFE